MSTRKTYVRLPENREAILSMLRATHGNIAEAARKLNVHRDTLDKWLAVPENRHDYETIKDRYVDDLLDQVETTLMKNLKARSGPTSNRAAETALRYAGKKRGYVPASYVEQDNRDNVTVRVIREGDEE